MQVASSALGGAHLGTHGPWQGRTAFQDPEARATMPHANAHHQVAPHLLNILTREEH